jgi:hypothetical protein
MRSSPSQNQSVVARIVGEGAVAVIIFVQGFVGDRERQVGVCHDIVVAAVVA